MHKIEKVVVIGSGVMGGAIAAHVTNAGLDVTLLDIVQEGATDRSVVARNAVARLSKANPAAFTKPKNASKITPGNIEDHLDACKDADWIVEAVIENAEIKRKLFEKIDAVRKKDAIVSSNTSVIPLIALTEGRSQSFKEHFIITHFFNPPRYMRLLELVVGAEVKEKTIAPIRDFLSERMGKGIVECKDTPGFIANRIGCYWLLKAANEAFDMGVTVEQVDALMGRPIGVPKTAVFSLFDLIGIDLVPLIAKEMQDVLDPEDPFCKIDTDNELIAKMIKDGYTGRKGKGGFFRLNIAEDGTKTKEALNLKTGEYAKAEKPNLESIEAAKKGLRNLLEHPDIGGQYAWKVVSEMLSYTASLVPEIADNVYAVDEAMKLGYNWKYGPFELIDRLGGKDCSGTKWLADKLEAEGRPVPELLKKVGDNPFYKEDGNSLYFMDSEGKPSAYEAPHDEWMLLDKKRGNKPILKNASASLWDIGDGIVCVEYTSKMNSVDPLTMEMLNKAIDKVEKEFKGLVIANDADNFCVGANIGLLLFSANVAAWKSLSALIKSGQDTYMRLKYAPFPVVGAVAGMGLGGGCEILLHCDGVQAHVETYTGLVEAGVGIVPAWGGTKEMILRQIARREASEKVTAKLGRMFSGLGIVRTANVMPALSKAFEYIAMAKVSKSAEEAKSMGILDRNGHITMNRARLLPDAKALCLDLAYNYEAPDPNVTVRLPGKTARVAFDMAIKGFVKSGKATPHDEVVSRALGNILSGGNTDINKEVTEQDLLDLELEAFMELSKTKATMDRVEHMLETGKPLRN